MGLLFQLFNISRGGRNLARGILPTADVWDVDPTDLENITNGNPEIGTGIGTKTLGGAGIAGTVEIDLGRSVFIVAMIRAAVWSTAATTYGTLNLYDDLRSSFSASRSSVDVWASTEHIRGWLPVVGYTSKIQMRLYASAAATLSCRIYEIVALEVLP